jgi:hypothetical protein
MRRRPFLDCQGSAARGASDNVTVIAGCVPASSFYNLD